MLPQCNLCRIPDNLMSDSSYSQSPALNEEEQQEILQQRFPHAGYWFNMLPTHPFIHGVENIPPQPTLPRPFHDLVSPQALYSVHDLAHAMNHVLAPSQQSQQLIHE